MKKTIATVLLVALPLWYFLGIYRVDGTSMNYGLIENDIVITAKYFHTIARGDLLVISHPQDLQGRLYLKRCTAVGGDRFFEKGRTFYLQLEGNTTKTKRYAQAYDLEAVATPSGYFLKEPYRKYYGVVHNSRLIVPPPLDHLPVTTVPKNHYYTLGDYRDNSADSRFYGAVPRAWVRSKVITIIKFPRTWEHLLRIKEAD